MRHTFRLNLNTDMVEILENGYVVMEIEQKLFRSFAFEAYTVAKYPEGLRKVRNYVNFTL